MNIKKAAASFLVMNLGTSDSPWNLFCGFDPEKNRIVFFKTLRLRSIPNYFSQEPVVITVNRDNQIFSSGSPQLVGPNDEAYQLDGLREICGVTHSTDQLDAFHFNDGDIVTVEKSDWAHDENPIDTLATRRTVGTPLHQVYSVNQHTIDQFKNFFKDSANILTTTVVVESNPGPIYMKYF
jgi:hypothetical protein